MKKLVFALIISTMISVIYSQTPCTGISTIVYADKIYHTVQIGTQCWLKENLNVGTMIQAKKNASDNGKIEKYCWDDDSSYCNKWGGYYKWNEAMEYNSTPDNKGICPEGFHIPTKEEFKVLMESVRRNSNAIRAMGQGKDDGEGTNTTGFTALLVGSRSHEGKYDSNSLRFGIFWTSTETESGDNANAVILLDIDHAFYEGQLSKSDGYSIRCIKD